MAEMIKAIKLTPHDPNIHLQLSDVLSQGSIILGFPCLPDEQVKKNADHVKKLLSSQVTADTIQGSIKVQLVDVQIKKSKHEQLKEAVDKFNSEEVAEPEECKIINSTYEIVHIYTGPLDNILTSDNQDSNNRYPVKFVPVPSTYTDDDEDLSTVFVKLTTFDHQRDTNVTMFIHFFDHTTALPMGTTQHYEPTGNNKLYLYDPLSDSNDPPPKGYYELLCYLERKLTDNIEEIRDRFLFKIGGILDLADVYPVQNSSNQRVSKDNADYAAIQESSSFQLSIRKTYSNVLSQQLASHV